MSRGLSQEWQLLKAHLDFEAFLIHHFQEPVSFVFVDLETCSEDLVSLLLNNEAPFRVFRLFRG